MPGSDSERLLGYVEDEQIGEKMQPWNFMNNQQHRNLEMLPAWRMLSTTICVLAFVVLLSGLLILPWKRLEVILLLAGIALLLIGMFVAEIPYNGAASVVQIAPRTNKTQRRKATRAQGTVPGNSSAGAQCRAPATDATMALRPCAFASLRFAIWRPTINSIVIGH